MSCILALKLLALFLHFRGSCCEVDYSYTGCKGPSHWASLYPECGAANQSPIDINAHNVENSPRWYQRLGFYNFVANRDRSYILNITNNGHSAIVRLVVENESEIPILHGGRGSSYQLDHIRFTWGPNNTMGSEHTFEGLRYPLELQAVFFLQGFGNLSNALTYKHTVLVISRPMKYSEREDPALTLMVQTLQQVQEAGSSAVSTDSVELSQLIPDYVETYFWYTGTLTMPPCEDTILWIIDYSTGAVSSTELEAFRGLKDSNGNPLSNNFRPVQPLGDRVVYWEVYHIYHGKEQ